MIKRALASTVAATMMLGGATVMADRGSQPDLRAPIMPDYGNWDQRDRRMIPMRPDNLDDLRLPYLEELRRAQEEAKAREAEAQKPEGETPDGENPDVRLPEIEIPVGPEEEPGFTIVIAEPDEPETPEVPEEEEVGDELLYHTGDILRASQEPTVLPEGQTYRVYFNSFGSTVCTRGSFYFYNGNLMFNSGISGIKVGNYVGFRVVINDRGSIELHPVTESDIAMYAASDAARQREMEEQIPTIDEYSIEQEEPVADEIPTADENPSDEQIPTVDVTPIVNVSVIPVVSTNTSTSSAPAVSAAPAAAATLVATQFGTEGFVNRLYTNALGREADSTGFAHWVNILNSKELTGTKVANGFFNSAEFASRDLNNVEFVTVLYRVFFDRMPDQAGLENWVNALNNGTTRAQVIDGFTGSSEWADTCAEFGIIA